MTSAFNGFRILLVAVIVPALITIAAIIVLLVLAASGPSRIATHWGFSGQVNGYGSPFTYPILMAAVALPLIALLGGGSVLIAHRGPLSPVIKLAAIAGLWMASLFGTLFIGALLTQRTSASVSTARSPGVEIIVGVAIALALALGGWFVLPRATRRSELNSQPATAAISLSDGERATWLRSVSASRRVVAVFLALTVVLGAVEILVIWLTNGRAWAAAFVPVLILLVLLSSFAWTVRVNGSGVRIRSAIGIPTISAPIENIVSATVVTVSPIAEFGGYGVRWSLNGRLGIILRSGEALEIRRRKGTDLVVTIDDAATAAALINGLIARSPATAEKE